MSGRSKVSRSCAHCGQEFFPSYSGLSRGMGKYCSRPCAIKARSAHRSFDENSLAYRLSDDGCHVFTGPKDRHGYGRVSLNGRLWLAHRLSYTENVGTIPSGMVVRHTCDNPLCIKPEHLVVGTQAQNMRDMILRKRVRDRRGEGNGRSVLTASNVMKIKAALRDQRPGLYAELSKEFGVSEGHLQNIKCGRTWAHVDVKGNLT